MDGFFGDKEVANRIGRPLHTKAIRTFESLVESTATGDAVGLPAPLLAALVGVLASLPAPAHMPSTTAV